MELSHQVRGGEQKYFIYVILHSKDARNKRIFEMWLACHTQEEIAEKENLSEEAVRKIISQQTAELPKVGKTYAEHLIDFDYV